MRSSDEMAARTPLRIESSTSNGRITAATAKMARKDMCHS